MEIGPKYKTNGDCEFVVWAPFRKLSLQLLTPKEQIFQMEKDEKGFWRATIENIQHEVCYRYILDSSLIRPDPASHFQPYGIYNASQTVNHVLFNWNDSDWKGIDLSSMIIYELHVGTFTAEGNFEAIIPRLEELRSIGINSIELMPIAQFPGERNWGYDGVFPFAVQNSYGGPIGLKKLVNECHKKGLAVILDVVYNHLGPVGNYLSDFGPYFTDKYKTPWGNAINYDGQYSDLVRNYFIENALHWFRNYHIDSLRLDAVHTIYDKSAKPFLKELAMCVRDYSKEQGRDFYLIAENDLRNSGMIQPAALTDYGINAQWCDDLHHCLHAILTGEHIGFYADFDSEQKLVQCMKNGYISLNRKTQLESENFNDMQFVVYCQNHDQIGNRIYGERLSSLISFEALKLAAGIVILSPFIPLLFMGEEFAADSPFLYFANYSNHYLTEAVKKGRLEEFKKIGLIGTQSDPFEIETFISSKLKWESRTSGNHKIMLKFYKHLLQLRTLLPVLSNLDRSCMDVDIIDNTNVIVMRRWADEHSVLIMLNFNKMDITFKLYAPPGRWWKILDSADILFGGPGTLMHSSFVTGDFITLRCNSVSVLNKVE